LLYLFECERLEDNPHHIMFGKGPEIAIFNTIAPYVSFHQYCFFQLWNWLVCIDYMSSVYTVSKKRHWYFTR